MLSDRDIVDGHLHLFNGSERDHLLSDLHHTGVRQFAVMVTCRNPADPGEQQWQNALRLKAAMPQQVFLFGGLDYTGVAEGRAAVPLEAQLAELIAMGCDGLKLLIGKPDQRQALAQPLDAPILQPMLQLAEDKGFPVVWHVGDPPEFWSKDTVPLWARQRGWWYPPGTPSKSQIDGEIARVFARHPRLRLILPHFFFLSAHLADAARLLEQYPSYHLDLAPGVEMYHAFTANRDAARDFFIRFASRIVFGSDFGMPCGWSPDRGNMIRRFLETDDFFDVPDDPAMTPDPRPPLHGLALPEESLELIYAGNFRRLAGDTPRPLRT